MRSRTAVQLALVGIATTLLVAGLALSVTHPSPDDLASLCLGLAIVVAAAVAGGHVAALMGQPTVLGELVAGAVLGNAPGLTRIDFIGTNPHLDILSRVGMLLLLFHVGLDLSVRDLFAVGLSALTVAVVGTVASFGAGTATAAMLMPGASAESHLFIGAAMTATSVGITARVLKDLGASRTAEARVILGAAVVDDVLGLMMLGVAAASFVPGVPGVPGGGALSAGGASLGPLAMKTAGFLVLAIVLGTLLTPIWFRQVARLRTNGALLAAGLSFCFLLSWASHAIGLAALVGAFAAGLILEDTHSELFVRRGERPLNELLEPMTSFLVPIFFVLVGFRTHVAALMDPNLLLFAVTLTAAAIAGKLACAAGVVTPGVRRLTVAAGMIPRGEVALVFAALGSTATAGGAALVDGRAYMAIVTVVVLTTVVTPPALKWTFRT